MGSKVLCLPESVGLMFNFQFEKTFRRSAEAVFLLAGKESAQTCAFRGVTEYISAAHSIGWDIAKGHLLPLALAGGSRGPIPTSAQRMTAALQGHLRMAGLPYHFTMHSVCVGGSVTESLACAAVDKIIKIGRWNTESIAKYYMGSTTSTGVRASKRTRDHGYARANESPLSQKFDSDLSACAPKYAKQTHNISTLK